MIGVFHESFRKTDSKEQSVDSSSPCRIKELGNTETEGNMKQLFHPQLKDEHDTHYLDSHSCWHQIATSYLQTIGFMHTVGSFRDMKIQLGSEAESTNNGNWTSMFILSFVLICPLSLVIKLNFNILKGPYWVSYPQTLRFVHTEVTSPAPLTAGNKLEYSTIRWRKQL